MSNQVTPTQARNKIATHLDQGNGIYAAGPGISARFFKAAVKAGALNVWNGSSWVEVPRGTQFNKGNGSGHLFTY
ncbi:MAG: hypothetical protein WC749_00835 [Dehalococcoidia bacterium]|uniref:hypothetical protein n=1 Tax=unclassified Pseudomonas TaxID=196821 RepID=UPI001475C188|nr:MULTISPECIES: hypothetical protein [unclassified Pseudomonas]NMX92516.1 hypothetical protein [Pseudomonas sp. WS 5086]NMY47206.1 hypothetical protein [Pseudomonas sp. WS 5027]